MKKLGGVLLVVLLGAGATACDGAPERITAPDGVRRGGGMYGSGNLTGVSSVAPDTTLTMDTVSGDGACVEERGGNTYGGGNLVDAGRCQTF